MNTPHAPLSIWVKIGRWFYDLVKMPGRVRILAKGLEAEADQRLKCPSCGAGRIGSLTRVPLSHGYMQTKGACDVCSARWDVSSDGKNIEGLSG